MDRHELQALVDEIAAHEGRGTELVTVTIPPDTDIHSIRDRIQQEHAQAENIKSDRTQDHVQRALDAVQRILQEYDQTPDNGLVACAGVVDDELVSYCLDSLPLPVAESTYVCDREFDTSVLETMRAPDQLFGLVIVERGEAIVGTLVGEMVRAEGTIESQVMGKTRAGGQSAQRFARERERQLHEHFCDVADVVNATHIADGEPVAGVVVGGTLDTAKQFADGDYLDHRLDILGPYSVAYATESGLEQLVDRASDQLLAERHRDRRSSLTAFFNGLAGDDPVVYGRASTERAIEFGAVDTLLVAPDIDDRATLESDVEHRGGEVCVVPGETGDGERFCEHFGGVGALCRFEVE